MFSINKVFSQVFSATVFGNIFFYCAILFQFFLRNAPWRGFIFLGSLLKKSKSWCWKLFLRFPNVALTRKTKLILWVQLWLFLICSLTNSMWPISPIDKGVSPVSVIKILLAAFLMDSPFCTMPPGMPHHPFDGSMARFKSSSFLFLTTAKSKQKRTIGETAISYYFWVKYRLIIVKYLIYCLTSQILKNK